MVNDGSYMVNIWLMMVHIWLMMVNIWLMIVNNNLVGGAITFFKNDGVKVSGKDDIPYMKWNNKNSCSKPPTSHDSQPTQLPDVW